MMPCVSKQPGAQLVQGQVGPARHIGSDHRVTIAELERLTVALRPGLRPPVALCRANAL